MKINLRKPFLSLPNFKIFQNKNKNKNKRIKKIFENEVKTTQIES